MHDLALIDATAFPSFIDSCTNGEVYNLVVRGGGHGDLDGIDIVETNIHMHDFMAFNRDERVTVKSPSSTSWWNRSTVTGPGVGLRIS